MVHRRVASLGVLVVSVLLASPADLFSATVEEVREALRVWNPATADLLLTQIGRDTPQALPLKAQAAFDQGRYAEALVLAEEAARRFPESHEVRQLLVLIQRTQDAVAGFRLFRSPHFALHLSEADDSLLAPYALEALEKGYAVVARDLHFAPTEPTRVEIFPDATRFNAASTLSLRDIEVTGAVGIAKFNKVMVLSPRVLVFGYRWLDALVHEYIHFAIIKLSRDRAPIWFHEGLARYEESRWRSRESLYLTPVTQTLLAPALASDRFIPFERMEPSLIRLESPEEVQLAYAEAASALDFFLREKGYPGLREALAEMGRRGKGGARGAIEKVMGIPFAEFETRWKRSLAEKDLQAVEGVRLPRFTVKEGMASEERMEMQEVRSGITRQRTHLADRLRERRRLAAALVEYRRALADSPRSPVILNKVGATLLLQGSAEAALDPLRQARALDPDRAGILVNLGKAALALERWGEAQSALEEALQINPFDPAVHSGLATVYEALGVKELAAREREASRRLAK